MTLKFGQRKDVIDLACKPISHVPCVNCDQHGGTTDHLLTRCVFTGEVWSRLLRSLGLALVGPAAEDKLGLLKREWLQSEVQKGFDSVVLLVTCMFGARGIGECSRGSHVCRWP
jgi:hypothetical protein